jgi:hypothetical protein
VERILTFEPAWDKRDKDPNKNYGIHGVNVRFVVKGDKGAVQFLLYTNWQLPHVQAEQESRPINPRYPHLMCTPLPADLGYHSLTPHYEGQTTMGPCEYLDGRPCYYDGSSLNAERPWKVLLEKGSDGVWKYLEDYYTSTFNTVETEEVNA